MKFKFKTLKFFRFAQELPMSSTPSTTRSMTTILPPRKARATLSGMNGIGIEQTEAELSLDEHVHVLKRLEEQRRELQREYGKRYVKILTAYGHRPAHLARRLHVTDASVVKRRDRFISLGWGAEDAA